MFEVDEKGKWFIKQGNDSQYVCVCKILLLTGGGAQRRMRQPNSPQ